MAGMVAKYAAGGIDAAGTHALGQITYWEKGGNTSSINNASIALGLTAFATNLLICAAAASDCNTNYGTSYTMLDVALAAGFVTV